MREHRKNLLQRYHDLFNRATRSGGPADLGRAAFFLLSAHPAPADNEGVTGKPVYAAAREAAQRAYPHFARHAQDGAGAALTPDAAIMEVLIDAAFWASLRQEEGFVPRISLAYVSPCELPSPLRFERPLPVAPQPLTKLAPAVERPGIHLGVWDAPSRGLEVWGATRALPPFCFVIEVLAPGLLVIKHSRGEDQGKFVNVAVLQGDEVKVIDQRAAAEPDCPALLTSLLGFDSPVGVAGPGNLLIELAISIREHGRGGLLLVVPSGTTGWRDSILHPITYSISPAFTALADLMQSGTPDRPERKWLEARGRLVDGIGGLTAVDGATLIGSQYELLAFGAKIIRRPGRPQVDAVLLTEPVEGNVAVGIEPGQLGGTRHMSAAQFAQDQRNAIALVASQDGRFTVFAWSPRERMVHAHRIETLLL